MAEGLEGPSSHRWQGGRRPRGVLTSGPGGGRVCWGDVEVSSTAPGTPLFKPCLKVIGKKTFRDTKDSPDFSTNTIKLFTTLLFLVH